MSTRALTSSKTVGFYYGTSPGVKIHQTLGRTAVAGPGGRYIYLIDSGYQEGSPSTPQHHIQRIDIETIITTPGGGYPFGLPYLSLWATLPAADPSDPYSGIYLSADDLYVVACTELGRRFRVAIADPLSIDELPRLRDETFNLPPDYSFFSIERRLPGDPIAYTLPNPTPNPRPLRVDLDTGIFKHMPAQPMFPHRGAVRGDYAYTVATFQTALGTWGSMASVGIGEQTFGRRTYYGMAQNQTDGKLSPLSAEGDFVTGTDAYRIAEDGVNMGGASDGLNPEYVFLSVGFRQYAFEVATGKLTLVAKNKGGGQGFGWPAYGHLLWVKEYNALFVVGKENGALLWG